MVNRCIELLNAKIAHAQTRHFVRQFPAMRMSSRQIDSDRLQRERLKTQKYQESKRLSMWEQDTDKKPQIDGEVRLDHSHYKHHGPNERKYYCTWIEFPENVRYKGLHSLAENQAVRPPKKLEKRVDLGKLNSVPRNLKLWSGSKKMARNRLSRS